MSDRTDESGSSASWQGSASWKGIGVSPGLASGPVVRLADMQVAAPERGSVDDRDAEADRLAAALASVVDDLEQRAEAAAQGGAAADATAAEILEATAMIAADPSLASAVRGQVLDDGVRAEWAVWQAMGRFRDTLAESGGYLAARASDLDDVRDRVLSALAGRPHRTISNLSRPSVLVAGDLAPVDTAGLDAARVVAIVCERGGPTSHTAILAGALGIPAVVACAGALEIEDGSVVTVDGETGEVSPGDAGTERRSARAHHGRVPDGGGRLADGTEVMLLANVGDLDGVHAALRNGAQGIGLLRTELLFLDRRDRPTVEQQRASYAQLLGAAQGRRVVVRTLDAGADKPLPFLGMPAEENPALGVRGVRIAEQDPDLLTEQLQAIALAAADTGATPWVMAPMISTPAEAREFARLARDYGLTVPGVMIEVPAAALRAADVVTEVEFVSIGTNDLTQYTLAADRNDARLAALNDPWQPAVLDLVARVARAGRSAGTPVGVCGEAAGDPLLAVVLAGLGVASLSMTPNRLGAVAQRLSSVDLGQAEAAAEAALAAVSASAARERVAALSTE